MSTKSKYCAKVADKTLMQDLLIRFELKYLIIVKIVKI